MSRCTILLNGVHLAVSEQEASYLAPLVAEISELSGSKFCPDPPSCMPPLPAGVLSPARLRALVEERLDLLPPVRAKELTLRILDALTVNGKHLSEIVKR